MMAYSGAIDSGDLHWLFSAGPHSDKRGGLNGSVQHLLAVYLPESQNPKSFVVADLSAARLCRVLLVCSRRGRFSLENTGARGHSCFRLCRAATGFADRRSRLSLSCPP